VSSRTYLPLAAARGTYADFEVVSNAVSARAPTPIEPVCCDNAAELETSATAPLLDTAAAYTRYAPYVAQIGMRILGRREEIEDFVQDVFVNVHRNLASLREPGALKSWLATLAVHEATRRLKRHRFRRWLGLADAPEYVDITDGEASPEERTLLAHVFRALDTLPADDRVAWSLRYIEGETMLRVASLCDCSLSTAKRRVTSAEQALERLGVGRV
jgi:RNA polymerase sigma-70 factor (ECF subfamily)